MTSDWPASDPEGRPDSSKDTGSRRDRMTFLAWRYRYSCRPNPERIRAGPRAFSLPSLITQRHAVDRHDLETGCCSGSGGASGSADNYGSVSYRICKRWPTRR